MASIFEPQNEQELSNLQGFFKKIDTALKTYMKETGASYEEACEVASNIIKKNTPKSKSINEEEKTDYFPY